MQLTQANHLGLKLLGRAIQPQLLEQVADLPRGPEPGELIFSWAVLAGKIECIFKGSFLAEIFTAQEHGSLLITTTDLTRQVPAEQAELHAVEEVGEVPGGNVCDTSVGKLDTKICENW